MCVGISEEEEQQQKGNRACLVQENDPYWSMPSGSESQGSTERVEVQFRSVFPARVCRSVWFLYLRTISGLWLALFLTGLFEEETRFAFEAHFLTVGLF